MSLLHFLIMNAEKFFHKKKETNPEFYSELVCVWHPLQVQRMFSFWRGLTTLYRMMVLAMCCPFGEYSADCPLIRNVLH